VVLRWLERHCAAPTTHSPGSTWLCGVPAPEGRLDSWAHQCSVRHPSRMECAPRAKIKAAYRLVGPCKASCRGGGPAWTRTYAIRSLPFASMLTNVSRETFDGWRAENADQQAW